MNKIYLQGIIKDIEYSHTIQGVEYYKARLITKRQDGKEDLINLKFKKYFIPYKDDEEVMLVGNVRTFSQKIDENSNKVEVYVFTYFDEIEDTNILIGSNNKVFLDGRICKKGDLKITQNNKKVIDFILANNIVSNNQSLNAYIPVVAWGKNAEKIASLNIGDTVEVEGQLQSREYKKKISDKDFEIRVAHEVNITNVILK